jgi:poly-gamma-glutamate synthesis protein (capsule biosynthesis protein)
MRLLFRIVSILVMTVLLSGCVLSNSPIQAAATRQAAQQTRTPTPFQPVINNSGQAPAAVPTRVTPTPVSQPVLWFDPAVPTGLRDRLQFGAEVSLTEDTQEANLHLQVVPGGRADSTWVYALVAPFPTVTDEVDTMDIRRIWRGDEAEVFAGQPLLVSPSTHAAFEAIWGSASTITVEVVDESELLDEAWARETAWALVPFELLEPRWKVMRVDGESPLDKNFDLDGYPLKVRFRIAEVTAPGTVILPATNRREDRMTVIAMTGVTALVRGIGARMESEGMHAPAGGIFTWLVEPDFTHISNEVSFLERCPPANPNQTSLMFCSRPEYFQLFQYLGIDIVELSGNHLADWGMDGLVNTLEMLDEAGMRYYAAGMNTEEARQPLLIEHNGNRIAFIGCNPVGPPNVWSDDERPGVAECEYDYPWIKAEIMRLRADGYLPIVTLQYGETYVAEPTATKKRDFPPLAEAGAVIVSGSQAHYPQGMEFTADGAFIHYGLGNLFFDQMRVPSGLGPKEFSEELPLAGTRLHFIDRHVFYDGRYISTELKTAILEDFYRPRPMTEEERAVFLRGMFEASGW